MITKICSIADLPKPQVAIVRTEVPNAFATGQSSNKAVVTVTTGILNKLSTTDLEAVLVHKLSYVKNSNMAVLTIASFLSTVTFYFVRYILCFIWEKIGGEMEEALCSFGWFQLQFGLSAFC